MVEGMSSHPSTRGAEQGTPRSLLAQSALDSPSGGALVCSSPLLSLSDPSRFLPLGINRPHSVSLAASKPIAYQLPTAASCLRVWFHPSSSVFFYIPRHQGPELQHSSGVKSTDDRPPSQPGAFWSALGIGLAPRLAWVAPSSVTSVWALHAYRCHHSRFPVTPPPQHAPNHVTPSPHSSTVSAFGHQPSSLSLRFIHSSDS